MPCWRWFVMDFVLILWPLETGRGRHLWRLVACSAWVAEGYLHNMMTSPSQEKVMEFKETFTLLSQAGPQHWKRNTLYKLSCLNFSTFFRFSSRSSFCRLLQVLFRYRYAEPIRHRAEVAACGLCDARQRERRRGEQTEANAKAVGGWDLGNGRLGAIKWVGTWNITFGKDTFQKIKSPLKMKYKTLRIKTDTAQLQRIIF